ncbi:MAG: response regulator, partial [Pseudomonadota bacterium]
MKILYVEDSQLDRDLTRRELKKSAPDFIMDTVATQRDALSALEKKRDYDLVLSDMRLPDGDGLAILTHIRGRGLPLAVVIITGQGDEETAVAALKSGAQDYVVKRDGYQGHLPLILQKALECYRDASIRSSQSLRVIYAEPSTSDADLTKRHLTNFAPHILMDVVSNASAVFKILSDQRNEQPYDAILLDYRLPGVNALEILKELRQVSKTDLPIILVTGQGDEEVAVQALKLGATDYVVKNPGYLYKLPSVLENAVHGVQLAREHGTVTQLKRQNELILHSAGEGIVGLDLAGNHSFVNPAAARMLGYEISEMVGLHSHSLWHHTKIDGSHCHEEACPIYAACREGVILHDQEDLFWRKDGTGFPVEFSLMPICEGDRLLGSVLTFRNITDRKRTEEQLQHTLESLRKAVGTTIQVMVSAVETRDPYTAGHQVRSST